MKDQNFEKSMKQLEEIVHDLEDGELPLEKAIKKFEEGMKLSKICSDKLNAVERKISIIMKDVDGRPMEKDFEVRDEEE